MKVATAYDDILFRVPDDWRDRSVLAFTAPPSAPDRYPPNFVASRHPLAPDQTLRDYAERTLYRCAEKLEGFKLLARDSMLVGNRTVDSFRCECTGPHGTMTQVQAFLPGEDGAVICLVATALSAEYAAAEPLFEAIWSSIRLP